jgi:hypothetical protein
VEHGAGIPLLASRTLRSGDHLEEITTITREEISISSPVPENRRCIIAFSSWTDMN